VLHEQLRNAWHARKRVVPISPVLNLTPEGLVLGAGTVMVPADGPRQLRSMRGQETRVLALLSAAYGNAIALSVLGNIERAAKAWSGGDDCLAYIHLAHAGLRELQDPYGSARRLFFVDEFLKAGTSPRAVFDAIGLGATYAAAAKAYNPAEPRVPAGSGSKSGQWTRELSFLGPLTPAAVESLGGFAARLLVSGGVATAAFGLLFIPSPNNLRVEGEVSGIPGLRYSWNRDESLLHLTYDGPDGDRQTFTAELQEDVFRDQRGQVVGRVLPQGDVAIELRALPLAPANDNEPKLCPDPGPDKPGELGRDYADYVKNIVNPGNPTPRYWGYQLPNPYNFGKLVNYDDCQHSTGTMVEAKGPGYIDPVKYGFIQQEWLEESGRQVDASAGRPIRWYFAELGPALSAWELFRTANNGRERITIVWLPWDGRRK
jgi:hypothetical protein